MKDHTEIMVVDYFTQFYGLNMHLDMKTEKNLNYEAPQVEIIEVEVEKGFATSNGIDSTETGIPGLEEGKGWL